MRCLHINIRQASFVILSLIANNISITQMADNNVEVTKKEEIKPNPSESDDIFLPKSPSSVIQMDLVLHCRSDLECKDLSTPCIECALDASCIYGDTITTKCKVKQMIECKGSKQFDKEMICRFCYQTEYWEHSCDLKANCNSVASPRAHYATNCTVNNDILCLGHRTFNKNVKCNWTGGYRWSTALVLSITLGGFGADRFYLGHWQEGIGKLFSFGGLGVWTLIDVILISLHYLGPADGSLYI